MKRFIIFLMVVIFIATMSFLGVGCKEEAATAEEVVEETTEEVAEETTEEETKEEAVEPVTIVVSSWRTEDQEKINSVNQLFMDANPNIIVDFAPVKRDEYEASTLVALEGGVGPDIVVMYGFDRGKPPYEAGYILGLNDWLEAEVPEVLELSDSAKAAWSADDGSIYGIPLLGVCNGFYYNKDIFDAYELEEPGTWAEFINICDILKADGVTAIAGGAKSSFFVANHGSMAYGPNFYGGEENRKKLMAGELKFTDQPFVDWFTAMDQLTQYYPEGAMAIDYESCQQLFTTGQAGVFIGGSWEIGTFASMGYDFELGWFPGPVVNEGDDLSFVFYPDQGWGINKDSKHIEEAKKYLKFVASCEFNMAFANALPGFFPFAQCDYVMEDPIAQEYVEVLLDPDTEITTRLVEEKLSSQEPSARTLLYDVAPKIVSKEFTPEDAVAYIQEGLETWYEPFQD